MWLDSTWYCHLGFPSHKRLDQTICRCPFQPRLFYDSVRLLTFTSSPTLSPNTVFYDYIITTSPSQLNLSQITLKLVLHQCNFTCPNNDELVIHERGEIRPNRGYFLLIPGVFTCCIFPPDKLQTLPYQRNGESKCKVTVTQATAANKNPWNQSTASFVAYTQF